MRAMCQLWYSFQASRKLRKLEKEDPADAIEFADIEAEGFAYLLRRRHSRVVVRCHTPMFVLRHYYQPEELPFRLGLISWLEKFCIRHADAVTAPSRDTALRISQECGISVNQITVIPNPIQIQPFDSAHSAATACDKANGWPEPSGKPKFTVVCVGRLERAKGIEVLARAIPLVLARIPHTRFVFIGGAADLSVWRFRLESLAGGNQASGEVELAGPVDDIELASWYHRADVAVVPSQLYESFSYTCAQAMAAGVAVVASCIGGIPETLDYGTCGTLVEPGNSEELANAIIHLAENPNLRRQMGCAGQRRAADAFASTRVARETLRRYGWLAQTELAFKAPRSSVACER
jgi:glycosyltransferase involved in cell wall biosynthesis